MQILHGPIHLAIWLTAAGVIVVALGGWRLTDLWTQNTELNGDETDENGNL